MNERAGPKILAKIKIYVLTRAELLYNLCYEIPCSKHAKLVKNSQKRANVIKVWPRRRPPVCTSKKSSDIS